MLVLSLSLSLLAGLALAQEQPQQEQQQQPAPTTSLAPLTTTSFSSSSSSSSIVSESSMGPTTAAPRPSVVSLILPTGIPIPSEASVIASDAAKTTYALDIECGANMDADVCAAVNVVDSITVIQGPKTYIESLSIDGAEFVGNCVLTGTTSAACTATLDYPDADIYAVETIELREADMTFFPVTITAWPGDEPEETDLGSGSPTGGAARGAGAGAAAQWAVGAAAVAGVIAAAL